MSQGLAQSARDVAVIGCVAVAASVALFIWDGGSVPSAADVETAIPASTIAGVTLPPPATAVTTVAPAGATTLTPTTAAAAVAGDVTQLPAPTAGTELPASTPGVRTWNVIGTTLAAVRDAYVPALTTAGWTSAPATPAVPDAEIYTITNAAGARLTVTFTQSGPDVLVVAAP